MQSIIKEDEPDSSKLLNTQNDGLIQGLKTIANTQESKFKEMISLTLIANFNQLNYTSSDSDDTNVLNNLRSIILLLNTIFPSKNGTVFKNQLCPIDQLINHKCFNDIKLAALEIILTYFQADPRNIFTTVKNKYYSAYFMIINKMTDRRDTALLDGVMHVPPMITPAYESIVANDWDISQLKKAIETIDGLLAVETQTDYIEQAVISCVIHNRPKHLEVLLDYFRDSYAKSIICHEAAYILCTIIDDALVPILQVLINNDIDINNQLESKTNTKTFFLLDTAVLNDCPDLTSLLLHNNARIVPTVFVKHINKCNENINDRNRSVGPYSSLSTLTNYIRDFKIPIDFTIVNDMIWNSPTLLNVKLITILQDWLILERDGLSIIYIIGISTTFNRCALSFLSNIIKKLLSICSIESLTKLLTVEAVNTMNNYCTKIPADIEIRSPCVYIYALQCYKSSITSDMLKRIPGSLISIRHAHLIEDITGLSSSSIEIQDIMLMKGFFPISVNIQAIETRMRLLISTKVMIELHTDYACNDVLLYRIQSELNDLATLHTAKKSTISNGRHN
jgi:hypothetical protein